MIKKISINTQKEHFVVGIITFKNVFINSTYYLFFCIDILY